MARAGSSGNHSPAGAQSTASAREVERGSNGEVLIAADIFLGGQNSGRPHDPHRRAGRAPEIVWGGDIIPGSMPVDMFPEHATLGARGADCRDVPAFDAPAE